MFLIGQQIERAVLGQERETRYWSGERVGLERAVLGYSRGLQYGPGEGWCPGPGRERYIFGKEMAVIGQERAGMG